MQHATSTESCWLTVWCDRVCGWAWGMGHGDGGGLVVLSLWIVIRVRAASGILAIAAQSVCGGASGGLAAPYVG